jgi:hypothetical protein
MIALVSAESHSGNGLKSYIIALENLLNDPQYLAKSDCKKNIQAFMDFRNLKFKTGNNQRMKIKSTVAERGKFPKKNSIIKIKKFLLRNIVNKY